LNGNPEVSKSICFITDVDLDREAAGGVMTESKMLAFLRMFGDVEVIYFKATKYRSRWLALVLFIILVFRSSLKPYRVFFSRGSMTSFILLLSKRLYGKQKKIVYRTVLPFVSAEVKHMGYNSFEGLLRYFLFHFLDRVVLFNVDMVVVPVVEYSDELVKFGIKRDRVHVIPFHVEDEFFKQPVKRVTDSSFKLCNVSGFHSYHNFFPLIEGFEALSKRRNKIELFLVGEGVMRSAVERKVLEKNLGDKVRFVGKIPHRAVPQFLSQMDVFVNMSRSPAISTSFLEAAAAGKAIVAVSKKENTVLNHYFTDGQDILMLNNASPPEIEKALELLYEDTQLRNSMAMGAREVAKKYFSKDVALRQLRGLLSQINIQS
jgi:glycosyltransferase involved in cell wall biosynthesis